MTNVFMCFHQDSVLTVQLYDWDLLGSDDLIGRQTFFSRNFSLGHSELGSGGGG